MDIEEQYDKIYRFCYYRVHSRELAEDLTQEVFLRFMNSNYEEQGKGIRYLYAIARNLLTDEMRRIKTGKIADDVSDEGSEANEVIERLYVEQALMLLDENDRELMVLRYMNGEAIKDISKLLGISRYAVYRSLGRIRETLKTLLKEDWE